VNLTTFSFTLTTFFLGYGFNIQHPNPLIFLLPILVLALLLVKISNSIYIIFTISVYIRVFLESDPASKWETNISNFRANLRKQKHFNPLTLFSELHFAVSATAMGAICILISLLYSSLWYQYLISVMVAVGWAIYCIIMWRPIWYVNSGLYEQEAEKVFRQLKAIDNTSNPKAE
jgi:hypothetical protein